MNSHPGVNEMLELLDRLKSVVRDFAAREEKLDGDFHVQSAAELNALARRNEAQESTVAGQEMNVAAALETERKQHQARFERRKARINRAHAAASKRVLNEIGARDAEWKEHTQQSVQAAELRRDGDLAGLTAAYNTFQQNLVVAGEELARLETAAYGAFGGYGKFRRLLARQRPWPEPDLSPDENKLFSELQKLQATTSAGLKQFKKKPLPLIFKFLPVWLLSALLLAVAAADPVLAHFGRNLVSHLQAGLALGAALLVILFYFLGRRAAAPLATAIAGELAGMRRLFDICIEKSDAHLHSEQGRIKNEFETSKNASTFISSKRGIAPEAELVCKVESTKCPVRAALIASDAVSLSRLQPARRG